MAVYRNSKCFVLFYYYYYYTLLRMFLFINEFMGLLWWIKQISNVTGDADIVSIPDIVDEIHFLSKASGTYVVILYKYSILCIVYVFNDFTLFYTKGRTQKSRESGLKTPCWVRSVIMRYLAVMFKSGLRCSLMYCVRLFTVQRLSDLVNKIAAPEFKNSAAVSTERGIPTSSGKAERKTVAQVHSAGVATSKQSAVNEPSAIDSCLNWNQELFDSWDACVFTPVPGDDLPSNQEAFGREAAVVLDNNRDSAEVIRTGFKAIEDRIAGFEKTFASVTERLDIIEKNQRLYNQSVVETLQNHIITHKQIIATQKLLAGEIRHVDHNQHLTTELLKQFVQKLG
ncbi:uncharacterized protein LOC128616761 [Ictalurus furcatus]|uniref:uncharacterized protein LOC128616761 n=1 Tax=Ictalurus furcatus TaxID=66913 RepID=UPI002350A083|nr:uncharacterized protein LOC128616761 [Ictalurus furcatus]